MAHEDDLVESSGATPNTPSRVRLPGFLIEEEVGLGDLIKRATAWIGIEACGGCEERAARLNRMVSIWPGRAPRR